MTASKTPLDNQTQPRVFTVIPAAGKSKRMGTPKQLLEFGGSTVLEAIIETVLYAGTDGLVVVTIRDIDDALELSEDPRFLTALLTDPRAEMLDSILLGVDRLTKQFAPTESDAFMVCPGDVPGLSGELVQSCVDEYLNHVGDIVVAAHDGKDGHPIVVPWGVLDRVRSLHGTGLQGILQIESDRVHRVNIDSDITQIDIDTPQDYETLNNRLNESADD
jgi:molybdenum cofactor cytidylyltransferase